MSREKKVEQPPPRVRLSKDVDLSKAKSSCKRCHGNGIKGYKQTDLGDGKGVQGIPIICRCVSRAGGVKQDEFDRILNEAKQEIDGGVFHERMVGDINRMPPEHKPRAVAGLLCEAVSSEKTVESREAIQKTLDLLGEQKDWPEIRGLAIRILIRDASDPICDDKQRDLATRAMAAARASMN